MKVLELTDEMVVEGEVGFLAGELPEGQLPGAGDVGLDHLHASGVGVAAAAGRGVGGATAP